MRYVFYGYLSEVTYNPHRYGHVFVDGTLYSDGKLRKTVGWEEFHSKSNVFGEVEEGKYVLINGENVRINSMVYDIDNDQYVCYTNKELSSVNVGMTEEQADEMIKKMKEEDRGFFSKLFKKK